MLCSRSSSDAAKNRQTKLIPISGRVPLLNLEFAHGRSGFQPTVENLPKGHHGSGGFLGGFCDGFFVGKSASQNQKKNPTALDPPQIDQPGPKSAAKPTNRSACQTSKWDWVLQVHAELFAIEKKVCSWRRLQSMDSGTLFGCLLGMVEAPMLKCTCNPSPAAGGRGKLCCAPFQTTFSVKSVRFEKTDQK